MLAAPTGETPLFSRSPRRGERERDRDATSRSSRSLADAEEGEGLHEKGGGSKTSSSASLMENGGGGTTRRKTGKGKRNTGGAGGGGSSKFSGCSCTWSTPVLVGVILALVLLGAVLHTTKLIRLLARQTSSQSSVPLSTTPPPPTVGELLLDGQDHLSVLLNSSLTALKAHSKEEAEMFASIKKEQKDALEEQSALLASLTEKAERQQEMLEKMETSVSVLQKGPSKIMSVEAPTTTPLPYHPPGFYYDYKPCAITELQTETETLKEEEKEPDVQKEKEKEKGKEKEKEKETGGGSKKEGEPANEKDKEASEVKPEVPSPTQTAPSTEAKKEDPFKGIDPSLIPPEMRTDKITDLKESPEIPTNKTSLAPMAGTAPPSSHEISSPEMQKEQDVPSPRRRLREASPDLEKRLNHQPPPPSEDPASVSASPNPPSSTPSNPPVPPELAAAPPNSTLSSPSQDQKSPVGGTETQVQKEQGTATSPLHKTPSQETTPKPTPPPPLPKKPKGPPRMEDLDPVKKAEVDFRVRYYLGPWYDRCAEINTQALIGENKLPKDGKLTEPLLFSASPDKRRKQENYLWSLRHLGFMEHRWKLKGFWQALYFRDIKQAWEDSGVSNDKLAALTAGDEFEPLMVPTIVKTRHSNCWNCVVMKINKSRHWLPVSNVTSVDIPWERKKNVLVWRGATTGFWEKPGRDQRKILLDKWGGKEKGKSIIDVGTNAIAQNNNVPQKSIRPKLSMKDMLTHKFILAVEGNDKASSLNWVLKSRSTLFAPAPFEIDSWLMERELVPYKHFVPVRRDFADLQERVEWCLNHDAKCKAIGEEGAKFMEKFEDTEMERIVSAEVFRRYASHVDWTIR